MSRYVSRLTSSYRGLIKVVFAFLLLNITALEVKGASNNDVVSSIAMIADSHELSIKSQKRVNELSDTALEVVDSILQNNRQSNITEAYNFQLSKLIESQVGEAESLRAQIDSIEETEQLMLPLLGMMVDQLSSFIKEDLPFLPEERNKRLLKLQRLIDRSDVSVAEKYSQILEAYLIEVEYGRTIEAYGGILLDADKQSHAVNSSKHVNYLRFGRLALYFQSLNGRHGGLWLPDKKVWLPLSSDQNFILSKAIQVAQKQRVPELLPLPVPLLASK